MTSPMEMARHELLRDVEDHVNVLCKNYKLDDTLCEQISVSVADFLAEHYFRKTTITKLLSGIWIFIKILTVITGFSWSKNTI